MKLLRMRFGEILKIIYGKKLTVIMRRKILARKDRKKVMSIWKSKLSSLFIEYRNSTEFIINVVNEYDEQPYKFKTYLEFSMKFLNYSYCEGSDEELIVDDEISFEARNQFEGIRKEIQKRILNSNF